MKQARTRFALATAALLTLSPLVLPSTGCVSTGPGAPTDHADALALSGSLGTRVAGFEADLRGGRADRAHARLETALQRAASGARSSEDHIELGYMLVRMGRGTEALTFLDLAVQAASGSQQLLMLARVWSARAHVLLEDYPLAERDYRAALEAADRIPGGTPTLQGATLDVVLTDVVRMRGDCSKAVANYERLARLADPHNHSGADLDVAHAVWARAETGIARCELEAGTADKALARASELEQWLKNHRDTRGRAYLDSLNVSDELLRLLSDIALAKGDIAQAKLRRQQSAQLVLGGATLSLDPQTIDTVLDASSFALAAGDAAEALRNLSTLRSTMEAQGIREGALAARVYGAEGAIALQAGDTGTAERGLAAAVAIQKKEGLELSLAQNLPLLASAQLAQGKTDVALQTAEEGFALATKHSAHQAAAHLALARATWAAGNLAQSLEHWRGLDAIEERVLHETMMFASGDAQRVILARQTPMIDISSVLAESGEPGTATFGLETLLRRKGRLLDASASTLGSLDARSGATKTKLEQIARLRSEVSRLSLSPPAGLAKDEVKDRLSALTGQIASIEATIGDDVSWISRTKQVKDLVAWQDIQSKLGPKEALVEYVDYSVFSPIDGAGATRRLGAYVLRREGAPRFVRLSSSPEVGAAVRQLREALASQKDWEARAHSLHQLVHQPLEAHLNGVDTLLLSPDGALNLVPFAVLGSAKATLFSQYALSYVSSGRDLVQAPPMNAHASDPIVIGSPSYDDRAGSSAGSVQQRSARMTGVRFTPLPATRIEGEQVAKLLKVKPFLESAATEALLKRSRGPRVLHIATHGFFLDAQENAARLGSRGLVYADAQGSAAVETLELQENPLLRSGLALAGANLPTTSGEDGVLTGLEAASLDLRGTQLVVLSACETGVGQVDAGEGVYGLRRAFQLASSETQVMSLWEVDDTATQLLMGEFYDNLSKGQGRSKALRDAQEWLRRKEGYAHPYFWAAFILSGERGPLHK